MSSFDSITHLDCFPTSSKATLNVADDGSPDGASPKLAIPADEMLTAHPIPIIRKDPDFYFNDVFVTFQAGDSLFRVTTYPFMRESDYFAKKFILPKQNDQEHTAPATIVLPTHIRSDDFRNLLKALYPSSIATKLSFSESEWISVLKLSTEWYFNNLRKIAILELEFLESLTSLNKIILGRLCFVSYWLLSGLTEIVERTETISNDDAIAMDHIKFTTIRLFRLRESRLQELRIQDLKNDRLFGESSATSSKAAVSREFEAELLSVKTEEHTFTFILAPPPLPPTPASPKSESGPRKKGIRR